MALWSAPAVRDAAQILGIRHLEILSYEDQMLASAPPDEIRRAMVAALRRQRPQIAVTFDPNGMNLHPDHIAISRFASDAVAAAADPRWCPETGEPHTVERMLWCGPWRVFDLGAMENIAGRAGMDFLIDISPYRDKKNAALRAHRTRAGIAKAQSKGVHCGRPPGVLPRDRTRKGLSTGAARPGDMVDKKTAFLRAFGSLGSIKLAALAVDVDRGSHYAWLRTDPKYRARFDSAFSLSSAEVSKRTS